MPYFTSKESFGDTSEVPGLLGSDGDPELVYERQ